MESIYLLSEESAIMQARDAMSPLQLSLISSSAYTYQPTSPRLAPTNHHSPRLKNRYIIIHFTQWTILLARRR